LSRNAKLSQTLQERQTIATHKLNVTMPANTNAKSSLHALCAIRLQGLNVLQSSNYKGNMQSHQTRAAPKHTMHSATAAQSTAALLHSQLQEQQAKASSQCCTAAAAAAAQHPRCLKTAAASAAQLAAGSSSAALAPPGAALAPRGAELAPRALSWRPVVGCLVGSRLLQSRAGLRKPAGIMTRQQPATAAAAAAAEGCDAFLYIVP
jgi:hypothetical protein